MKKIYGGAMMAEPISIMCYPLYSILLAIGHLRVDLLSLDVEGAELPILRTIPFDKVYIDVIMVEYLVWSSVPDSQRKLNDLRKFFADTKLYREAGQVKNMDVVFQRIDSV